MFPIKTVITLGEVIAVFYLANQYVYTFTLKLTL